MCFFSASWAFSPDVVGYDHSRNWCVYFLFIALRFPPGVGRYDSRRDARTGSTALPFSWSGPVLFGYFAVFRMFVFVFAFHSNSVVVLYYIVFLVRNSITSSQKWDRVHYFRILSSLSLASDLIRLRFLARPPSMR